LAASAGAGALAGALVSGSDFPGSFWTGSFWALACAPGSKRKSAAANDIENVRDRVSCFIILGIPLLFGQADGNRIPCRMADKAAKAAGGSNSAYCTDDFNLDLSQTRREARDF
jgi:hypothetical protein